jgi:uncharacterized membrane protein
MIEQHHSQRLLEPSTTQQTPGSLTTLPEPSRKLARDKERSLLIIGWILRCGVIASAVVTLLGLLLLLFRPGGLAGLSLDTFPHTLSDVWVGLLALHPQAIIALGLLLLIATPVVTVTGSAIAFAVEHDRRFVVIALLVLAILLTSFLLGRNG